MSHNQNFWIGERGQNWNGMESNKIEILKSTTLFSDTCHLLYVVKKVKPTAEITNLISLTSFLNRKNSFLNWMNLKERKRDIFKRQMVKMEFGELIWRDKSCELERKGKFNKCWLWAMYFSVVFFFNVWLRSQHAKSKIYTLIILSYKLCLFHAILLWY